MNPLDALHACRVLGPQVGLPVADLRVISDRGNLIIRFGHTEVVARVCSLTALTRRDPFAWLEREVQVCRYAAGKAGPVVHPAAGIDPGPHTVDGVHLSLWRYVRAESRTPTARDVGVALAGLHECLRDYPGDLAIMAPVREQISDGLGALDGVWSTADLRAVSRLQLRYLAQTSWAPDDFVLHGDAHPGNLLSVTGRWLWVDLEETCRGPIYWDLAVLHCGTRVDGPSAIRAYCAVAEREIPSTAVLRPFIRLREIEAAVWAAGMSVQRPDRYRAMAADLLDRALRPSETGY